MFTAKPEAPSKDERKADEPGSRFQDLLRSYQVSPGRGPSLHVCARLGLGREHGAEGKRVGLRLRDGGR